jgi:hypothetical protein
MAGDREAAVGRWWSGARRLVDEEAAMVGAQDLAMRENGGGRDKKNRRRDLTVSKPAYICRLTDEYRRARTVRPVPPIFIG